MYKLQYGSKANSLYRKINDLWLPIGFWVVGCKDFNSERAYRHLSQAEKNNEAFFEAESEDEAQSQVQEQSLSFIDFKTIMENKGSW